MSLDINVENFYQLLRGHAFQNVDISQPVYEHIMKASLPINTQLGPVIKQYVQSIFQSPDVRALPEDMIAEPLCQSVDVTPSQVLLLFYVLYHNECIPSESASDYPAYSTTLLENVPIKSILTHAELSPDYREIYPDLLCCVANQCPELFDVRACLVEVGSREKAEMEPSLPIKVVKRKVNGRLLERHLQAPLEAANELHQLMNLPASEYMNVIDIVTGAMLPSLLDEGASPVVQEAFVAAWDVLNSVAPRELWVSTVNFLCANDAPYTQVLSFATTIDVKSMLTLIIITINSLKSLIADPLIIFKADTRIFRSPMLFSVFLTTLGSLRTASRHKAWQRFSTVFANKEHLFNARNVTTMLYAQDSTMLQFLLEICLPKEWERLELVEAIQSQICTFIHGLFIDDQILVKLLHFQTYDKRLLRMLVKNVPSIYITANFLPELLRQPQPEQQVFGILLAGHLFQQYPLENYVALAEKHVLTRLSRLAFPSTRDGSIPAVQTTPYLFEALPATALLAKAFPHLAPEILIIMKDISEALPTTKAVDFWADPKSVICEQIRERLDNLLREVEHYAKNMGNVNNNTM